MNDHYTLQDIIDTLEAEIDPDLLVEMLELSTREIAEAFADKVWLYRERFLDE